jgi:hypothetical protein
LKAIKLIQAGICKIALRLKTVTSMEPVKGLATTWVTFFSTLRTMLSLLTILLALGPAALSGEARQSNGTVRPCASSWNAPATGAKKQRPKNGPKEVQDAPACIEFSASGLDVQEYLQSYSRSQRWTIVEEHVLEDSWNFSLTISKDELLKATKALSSSEKVEWRSGVALVHVNSTPLPDGFTRTVVRARFRGYGEPADKFAPPREYWELESSGSFEASVVSALKAHFKAEP